MKDKEKQIEEMQKTLCTTDCQECMSEYLDFLKEHNLCGDSTTEMKKRCIFHEQSEKLYNAGYRKLPENAFILTNDNAEELANLIVTSPQMQSVMSNLIKAWQKKTAEKILNEIYTVLWDEKTPIANSFVNLDVKIREIATREGVEIRG